MLSLTLRDSWLGIVEVIVPDHAQLLLADFTHCHFHVSPYWLHLSRGRKKLFREFSYLRSFEFYHCISTQSSHRGISILFVKLCRLYYGIIAASLCFYISICYAASPDIARVTMVVAEPNSEASRK